MTIKNKIISALLAATMLSGMYVPFVSAEDNIVVYSYENDADETVNITQADIDAGNWNIDYMKNMPIEQYSEFPVMLTSEVYGEAKLSMSATYLKVLGAEDTARLSVKERGASAELFSKSFTAEDIHLGIDELPINKVMNFTLTETIDGITKTYTSVISTYYGEATMPENVSLDNTEHDLLGIEAGKLRIRNMSQEPTFTEDENGDTVYDDHVDHIYPAELQAYYTAINNNDLYSIQASTGEDIYRGFISKSNIYNCSYIFVPRYNYYTESDYIALENTPSRMSAFSTFGIIDSIESIDLEEAKQVSGNYYYDVSTTLDEDNSWYRIFEIQLQSTGAHNIKTYGNIATYGYYGVSEERYQLPPSWYLMGDENIGTPIDKNFLALEGLYVYVIICTKAEMGNVAMCVTRTDTTDSISNSVQQTHLSGEYMTMNTEYTSSIEYSHDVDVFKLDNTVDGNYVIKVQNLSTNILNPVSNIVEDDEENTEENDALDTIRVELLYSNMNDDYTFINDSMINNQNVKVLPATTEFNHYYLYRKANDYHYYIRVRSKFANVPYKLEAMKPQKEDPYESNDFNEEATDLATLTSPVSGLTIHKNNNDVFKFTTGAGGADISINITKAECTAVYGLDIRDADGVVVATGTAGTTGNSVTATGLTANNDYYINVTRNDANNYCPAHTYTLTWTLTQNPVYTATINNNIALEYTEGEANIDTVRQAVANGITFMADNTAITADNALADVVLYYVNGTEQTELTSTVLSSLTAGNYTLVAKFHGIEATGGTITLTLNAAASSVIEVSYIAEDAANAEWDWVACGKMIADHRRIREGNTASDVSVYDAVMMLYPAIDSSITEDEALDHLERVGVSNAVKAARYFYNNGTSLTSSKFVTKTTAANEDYFYTRLSADKLVVMYLKSSNDATNVYTNGRYVVVCGIDTVNQKYKLYDPVTLTAAWYTYDSVTNGGVLGRSDLSYSGLVIENP